jgi:hypothetical protein
MPGKYRFLRSIEGAPQGAFRRIGPVAVDAGSGNIYVVEEQLNVVDEFDPEGKYLGRLTGTPSGAFHRAKSVAVDPVDHHVFVGDYSEEAVRGSIDAYGVDLVIPDVETLATTEVSAEGARLNGTINPRGAGAASCRFVWGESEALGNVATCPPVTNGEAAVPRSATLKALTPDTKYFYRLQAGNGNGLNPGEPFQDQSFTTPGPGVHEQWTSDVSSSSATLNARVDPHGKPARVFFEYGPSASYGSRAPAPPVAIGSGEEDVQVEAHLQALTAGTLYHYRAVAVDELGEFHGPDHTFTTQGVGGLVLPDGRGWELVSPPDKHGAQLLPIGEAGVVQSSASGAAMTYLGSRPTEEHVLGFYDQVQILSVRGAGGWSSRDISLPHAAATGTPTGGVGQEYRFFSSDLSRALVEPQGLFTSLTPEVSPPDNERTPYVRHDSTCAAAPSTCFEPLVTDARGYADVPEGTMFGGAKENRGAVLFVGGTPDLAHVILTSNVDLTSIPTGGRGGLYEWSADRPPGEELRLVSLLPENRGPAEESRLGSVNNSARHAVSDDGSRIVWSEENDDQYIYMRDMAKQQTVQLDLPEATCSKSECGGEHLAPQFQAASRDGSKVFFTDTQRLTRDSGALSEKPDLYECEIVEVGGELRCRLSDLTPPTFGEAADVRGTVLGASEDGTWLYFVANGVLGEGAKHGAVPGNCNGIAGQNGEEECTLYAWHDGTTMPITVLSGADSSDWVEATAGQLEQLAARASPDGGWLAFMSSRSLTGYDNVDANSPASEPHHDQEVFLYHAQVSGAGKLEQGRLVCASCNPTGARPVGVEYEKLNGGLAGGDGIWRPKTWIAANVPGWTPYQSSGESSGALYQSRYLSDEGRLFFNSSDALVPQDINHNEDVYEYEPAGVGGCSPTSPTLSERSNGCVALISSGRAAGESAFLDASENGEDVFFLTGERLVPRDVDTALDVYDAHVCSAAVPCFSSTATPPACTTADICRSAPTPQPQIFGPPASATFSGQGNITPLAPKRVTSTRAQLLAKALGSCRRKYSKSRKRRAACERQARKRYAAKESRKSTKRGKL